MLNICVYHQVFSADIASHLIWSSVDLPKSQNNEYSLRLMPQWQGKIMVKLKPFSIWDENSKTIALWYIHVNTRFLVMLRITGFYFHVKVMLKYQNQHETIFEPWQFPTFKRPRPGIYWTQICCFFMVYHFS